jgi:hypothetical protein
MPGVAQVQENAGSACKTGIFPGGHASPALFPFRLAPAAPGAMSLQ